MIMWFVLMYKNVQNKRYKTLPTAWYRFPVNEAKASQWYGLEEHKKSFKHSTLRTGQHRLILLKMLALANPRLTIPISKCATQRPLNFIL